MDSEADLEQAPYHLDLAHEQHGHPPLTEVHGDLWEKWDEWAEPVRVHYQSHRMKEFDIIIEPKLDYYYELGLEKLGTIS